MRIVVLGAGQVGSTLAELLVAEEHDVTVVDQDPQRLTELQSHMDIQTFCGSASHPSVLLDAGVNDADMLIAVTNSDEVNMIACQVAYSLYRTPQKIARVRAMPYLQAKGLFQNDALPIDVIISPEQLVCDDIRALIEYPDALQVMTFADDRVFGLGITLQADSLAQNKHPLDLPIVARGDGQVALIWREDRYIVPRGDDFRLQENDNVYIVTTRPLLQDFMNYFRPVTSDYERVIIAGGGNIGSRLAQALQANFHVKIIDHSPEHTDSLASTLTDAIVLLGEASDRDLLLNESIEKTDVFCAVTNAEEVNIMSAMLAKSLGAHKVMALVNNPSYLELMANQEIDTLISPRHATVSSILTYIRRGDVVKAQALTQGAEAIEAIAHGELSSSKIVGRRVSDIDWPTGVHLAAIIRRSETLFDISQQAIKASDHLILFIADKAQISETERLFQVGITYI
ncbi:MAG: Trk system potassium transporter TrkA [Legionellales bacterium]|nr:Trk system potassium transporter TrkA [Legionellales bacterium]|tara:strand:+ start:158 stop:1528 length:1371 start_codon:yes stop_codon:yes gene_type:complete